MVLFQPQLEGEKERGRGERRGESCLGNHRGSSIKGKETLSKMLQAFMNRSLQTPRVCLSWRRRAHKAQPPAGPGRTALPGCSGAGTGCREGNGAVERGMGLWRGEWGCGEGKGAWAPAEGAQGQVSLPSHLHPRSR